MERKVRRKYKGQTLVLVGLLFGMGVLIGLVALAFDGGSALLQRRNMQNGADAAALGTAKMLAASVILSGSVPIYGAQNQQVASTTVQFLSANRGGVTGVPSYAATVEYGNFVQNTSSYTFTVAATYDGASWSYNPSFANTSLVPNWVDAVRVSSSINNPTTFAGAIGISSIPVSAKAAAALSGVSNFVPTGPTWPMIAVASPTPDPSQGICNPVLFWSNQGGNFKNLVSLAAEQGSTWEGTHFQLISQADPRGPLTDATQGNKNYIQCPPGQAVGLWSPKGSCSATNGTGTLGQFCCSGSANNGPVDVANWITHDFTGRLSLTTTSWLGQDNQYHDWRSAEDPNSHVTGDWPEVYNGGNFGNAVQQPIFDYINSPQHRQVDDFYPFYGYHVDKVMYRYDVAEVWATATSPNCGGQGQPPCPMAWLSTTDPRAGNNPTAGRVHLSQALIFRFYSQMASQGGFTTPAQYCGTPQSISTSGSKVYGVFVGEEVTDPPPNPGPSGLYNYVGFIDP